MLSPSAYALQQKLAVNFRSPQVGAEVFQDPYEVTLGDGVTITDDSVAPLEWSPKYGIENAPGVNPATGGIYGAAIFVTDLPGITGMWIDDINQPTAFHGGGPLFFVSLGPNDITLVGGDSGGNSARDFLDPNVIITVGPGGPMQLGGIQTPKETIEPDGTGREFVSFSEPIDQVFVSGYNGAFAIEGFTESVSRPEHVPDGGSTLVLFATGLFGLVGMQMIRKRMLCQHAPLPSSGN